MKMTDLWIQTAKKKIQNDQENWLVDANNVFASLLASELRSAAESTVYAWKAICKDGAFGDIDYPNQQAGTDTGALYEHLDRVHAIASFGLQKKEAAYVTCAARALDYFATKNYTTDNWFHTTIGLSLRAARCLIILAEVKQMPVSSLDYIRGIAHIDLNRAGANKVDLAYIQLLWAMAGWKSTADVDYLTHAYAASRAVAHCCEFATLSAPTWGEGLRVDYSYSQHNPYVADDRVCSQLYTGSYGAEFLVNVCKFISRVSGVFELPPASLENIELHLLEGVGWCGYAGHYDFHALGRSISREGGRRTSVWSGWCDALLPTANNPERLEELKTLASGETLTTPGFKGTRAFWTNDYLAHIDSDFAIFCKMVSTRTVGTETGNGENRRGYYIGCGTYFVHTHGVEYENIQPVWNWQYLPGTTVEEEPRFAYPKLEWGKGAWGSHDFAGVVSDGELGVATMVLTRANIKEARKTVIALAGEVYCLGLAGDLSGVSYNVHTTVNSCWLNSDNGVVLEGDGETHTLRSGVVSASKYSKVRHDGIAYQFLIPADLTVELTTGRGSWNDINEGLAATQVIGDVFYLWINHGKRSDDKYAYVIHKEGHAPSQPDFVCSADAQYVFLKEKGIAGGAAFSSSAVIDLGQVKISANNPFAFVAHFNASRLTLTISDPTQKLDILEINLAWQLGSYDHILQLPIDGDYRGKGVTIECSDKGIL